MEVILPESSRFAGKSVIVTGAARGIGEGIAERFAREGANVLLVDIDRQVTDTAVVGPAGMPPDDVNALNAEIGKLLTSPELSKFLAGEGAEAKSMTPPEFADLIRNETGRWGKVAHEANISID